MVSTFRNWVLIAIFGLALPPVTHAQLFRNPFRLHCCHTCQQPQVHCTCTATQPVVETTYRSEPVVTYRDVSQTEYRQQAYTETVPQTTYRTVNVDEGSYQQVWVPKVVTKQVAETVYQQQTRYRSVPYQVTRRVPQLSTRLVPQQSVRYVPQQFQTVLNPGCSTCGGGAPNSAMAVPEVAPPINTSYALPSYSPYARSLPQTAYAQPLPAFAPPITTSQAVSLSAGTGSIATMPTLTVPTDSAGLVPDARYADVNSASESGEWVTIGRRTDDPGDTQVEGNAPIRSAQRSGLFVPAPSAATVWQVQSAVRRY